MLTIYIAIDRTGYIIPLILSVLIHESAHILCLLFFKCKIKSVRLLLGTFSVQYSLPPSDIARLISLLCGPLSNLAVSIISFVFKNNTLFGVNLLLFLYNLLPVDGLDGGEILEIILHRFLSHNKISKIMNYLTLSVTSVFCMTFFTITNNFSFIILCFYILSGLIFKKILKDTHI